MDDPSIYLGKTCFEREKQLQTPCDTAGLDTVKDAREIYVTGQAD